MIPSLSRATRSMWVLLGVVVGCSSGRGGRAATSPPPRPAMSAEDIEHSGDRPIEAVLQAKAPGALITRTDDGGIAVQIRGPGSFYSSNQPLYVIDDVPITPGPRGALTGINPHDIESIEVLKNPQDTGLYGVRGANGVIKITMKKPGRRDG